MTTSCEHLLERSVYQIYRETCLLREIRSKLKKQNEHNIYSLTSKADSIEITRTASNGSLNDAEVNSNRNWDDKQAMMIALQIAQSLTSHAERRRADEPKKI